MSARIQWIDERWVEVSGNGASWEVPMKYESGLFAFSDGILVEASRKGDLPRVRVLSNGGEFTETRDDTTGETVVVLEGKISWFARAWEYHSL